MNSTLATAPRICPCPSCGEMIYSDSATCRFCSATIDRDSAEAAATKQKQVNDAVNLAKWARNIAGVMWILVGLGLVFGIASLGASICVLVIPVALIFWQVKYGRLQTADVDFKKARRDRLIALLLWAPASVIQLLLILASVIL